MRLRDYLELVGVRGPVERSVAGLRRLHEAHREKFLFENLSIQEGSGISVALPDVERKFLDERRGGYCFEQNTLFAAVLSEHGFEVTTLLGRVRRGPPESWARTHMVLAVYAGKRQPPAGRRETEASAPFEAPEAPGDAQRWLADVGFGAIGLVEPIPLRPGTVSQQRGLTYALRREGRVWVLSMRDASQQTMDLYEFSEEPQTHMDVVVANHYTSTHPDSIFRRSLTIQGVQGEARTILRSHVLTQYIDGVLNERPIDRPELDRLARELFGVALPPRPLLYETEAGVGQA